jgi:hypothetical protein
MFPAKAETKKGQSPPQAELKKTKTGTKQTNNPINKNQINNLLQKQEKKGAKTVRRRRNSQKNKPKTNNIRPKNTSVKS